MREEFVGLIVLCVFVLGFCIGGCCEMDWTTARTTARLQKAAIEHKAGQYNPTTGKFEWLDRPEKE